MNFYTFGEPIFFSLVFSENQICFIISLEPNKLMIFKSGTMKYVNHDIHFIELCFIPKTLLFVSHSLQKRVIFVQTIVFIVIRNSICFLTHR